jgi:N-acetylmuramoyl-L-alanine amidase
LPSPKRTQTAYGHGVGARGCAILAMTVALSLLSIDTGYAGWWPWSREPAKVSPKRVAAPKRVTKSKEAAAPKRVAKPKVAKPKQVTASKPGPLKPVSSTCEPSKLRVVLDVGHTAQSGGAMSARNIPEFDFNVQIARRIEDRLKSEGFAETRLLVTEGKARASLFKRVAAANQSKTDLFLSIHHDSVPNALLEKWEFDGKTRRFSDRFSGYSLFVSPSNPRFEASLAFARLLGHQLKGQGLEYATQYTLPIMGRYRRKLLDKDVGVYRYDELIVLGRTQMPAVLLEAGSIINRDEELAMSSPVRQDMISAAVAGAVREFCQPRKPLDVPVAGRSLDGGGP